MFNFVAVLAEAQPAAAGSLLMPLILIGGMIYYSLVCRPTETKPKSLLCLDISAVYENIDVRKKLCGYIQRLGMIAYSRGQLFIEIAREEPYILVWKSSLKLADKRKKTDLVFGLHRLTAQKRESANAGVIHTVKYTLRYLIGKRLAVVKAPGFRLEAILTSVAAA